MGNCGHNRHGPKRGGLLCPFHGKLGPHLIQCGLGPGLLRTKWCLHPSSRLAIKDINRKLRGCAPFRGDLRPHLTQRRLGRGLPPYQVASWSMQPFGRNGYGPKIGKLLQHGWQQPYWICLLWCSWRCGWQAPRWFVMPRDSLTRTKRETLSTPFCKRVYMSSPVLKCQKQLRLTVSIKFVFVCHFSSHHGLYYTASLNYGKVLNYLFIPSANYF